MQYMIIERFHPGKIKAIYQRFAEHGRLMPSEVTFVNSWIDKDVTTCYQVMESSSRDKLQEWINNWSDLADFEVIPVITSAEAKAKVMGA